jgi:hypothetical protein
LTTVPLPPPTTSVIVLFVFKICDVAYYLPYVYPHSLKSIAIAPTSPHFRSRCTERFGWLNGERSSRPSLAGTDDAGPAWDRALNASVLPNGRAMSPSHTRRRGRIYRYYVSRDAIADGYDSCPITSVPAADVEGAVLDHLQKLLAAPELVARTWASAKREGDEIMEREVTVLLADFATVWNELFPAEQARIVQLLVERVDVQEDALEVRIRAEGLASLVGELRQQGERIAARGRASRRGWTAKRLLSDALPAPRRPQADRRAGRQRAYARDKAAAGRHVGQGAGSGLALAAHGWTTGCTRQSARSATPRTVGSCG